MMKMLKWTGGLWLGLSATMALAAPSRHAPVHGPAAAVKLDTQLLIGLWTDDGDCSEAIEFSDDGHFTNADGTGGDWQLDGDELTMSGTSSTTIRIVPVDRNTLTIVNADGSLGRSTRCRGRDNSVVQTDQA
jgi:hypothetical protein